MELLTKENLKTYVGVEKQLKDYSTVVQEDYKQCVQHITDAIRTMEGGIYTDVRNCTIGAINLLKKCGFEIKLLSPLETGVSYDEKYFTFEIKIDLDDTTHSYKSKQELLTNPK